ncbi:MBL fold metallo-hydrolase [Planctomycetota bacterium]|nr:MBL fold metallo-hydrolase [Planctomycetota bacterium]
MKDKKRWPRVRKVFKYSGILFGAFFIFLVAVWLSAWEAYGHSPTGAQLERIENSPQWSDGEFHNVKEPVWPSITGMLWHTIFENSENTRPDATIPIIKRSKADFDTPPSDGLRVTWIGHCTSLIEIDGQRVLTDPVWGERASPLTWAGPSRFYEPPLALEDVPQLDAILISHDHYDHLDFVTVKQWLDLDTRWVVPLGVGAHLEYWGVKPERITELDWWEDVKVGELTLTCTPARHFSGRSAVGADRNETLWAGWAVTGPEHRVFFSGDTALHHELAEIGTKLGPFDLTMIDTGAYSEQWPDVHGGPEQAVIAHTMLKGKVLLPVGWGSFDLSTHGWTEPVERLIVAANKQGVTIAIPKPGGFVVPEKVGEVKRWWPQLEWRTAEELAIRSSSVDDLQDD